MNFDLSEEQVILRDALAGYLSHHWDQQRHNQGGVPARKALWDGIAGELGLMAIAVPERAGGSGGGLDDIMVVAQELGRCLALDGFIPTVAYGGNLFTATGDLARLETIASGAMVLALAHAETGLLPDGRAVATTVTDTGLTGVKVMVAGAQLASHVIVSAMEPGQTAYSLYLVPNDAPGIARQDFNMIDGQPSSELTLGGVAVGADMRIGAAGAGPDLHRRAADIATVAHSAEAVGMMETLIRTTVDYLQGRSQFGQKLAAFQVLQHRLADMVLHLEDARSMLFQTVLADQGDRDGFERAVTGMKVKVAEALRFVSQQAVQLHGGMGITDELMVGHFFKRAMTVNEAYGGPAAFRKRYEKSLG
ncbi:acyl-CoA dehydrogenase family protein [Chachezhania sediminis]|uniref:acyl-CoA dehydrogenase family protein n=1 Tax=Chachezhania sediminis TaxID=2599291 RepID=UPI00131DAE51|nr:acyl-CoA dehydrogenase family protein [Chachezhania sediminis]